MNNKKSTSLAKIKSNKKNALKSTGPKTTKGKNIVKWNAVKHGILSEEVIIRAGDGEENAEQFKWLLSQLLADLQPEGFLENMLVEKIAICYWRMRRVLRCEIGEIRSGLDLISWKTKMNQSESVAYDIKYSVMEAPVRDLIKSTTGLKYLNRVMEEIKAELNETGYLNDEAQKRVIEIFGGEKDSFGETCLFFNFLLIDGLKEQPLDSEKSKDLPDPSLVKNALLELMNNEIDGLKIIMVLMENNEKLELEAAIASRALPSKEAAEKILRYESAIERQLYKAINQLERIQRHRKGEPVPAPVSLDVSAQS